MRPLYKEDNKRNEKTDWFGMVDTGKGRQRAAALKWFNAESMLWLSKMYSIRHEGNIGLWP